jgi:hypothetical protein
MVEEMMVGRIGLESPTDMMCLYHQGRERVMREMLFRVEVESAKMCAWGEFDCEKGASAS